MLKQVSIFAENEKGAMLKVLACLSAENINVLGHVTNDSAEYGIIRMIVSDPEKAKQVLEGQGYLCKLTSVLGVEIDDTPGSLQKVLQMLTDMNVNVDYIYLSFNRENKAPVIVFHTDSPREVANALKSKGVKVQ